MSGGERAQGSSATEAAAPARESEAGAGERAGEPAEPGTVARQPDWPLWVLDVVRIGMASASLALGLFVAALPPDAFDAFLSANELQRGWRKPLMAGAFAALLLPIAGLGAVLLLRRERAAPAIARLADLCSPLLIAVVVPYLLAPRLWHDQPLRYLPLLAATVLLLERLARSAFARDAGSSATTGLVARCAQALGVLPARVVTALPLAVVLLAATGYALYTGHFTVMAHQRLETSGFDLGIFDNLMFNALHGRLFYSSIAVPSGSYLSNHAEFAMFLFLPLYALAPGPEFMLWLQSWAIGLGAVPLYLFGRTQLPPWPAALLAVAYLLYAPVHGANFYDFHWMPVGMVFFFGLFWALATGRHVLATVLAVVAALVREDAAFGLIALGLFLIATRARPRAGAILVAISVAWFVAVKFVIMPAAGPWWFADIYKELYEPGKKGYGSVVRTIITNPSFFVGTLLTEAKLGYTLHLFAPLAFLPLRRPALALLMLPGFIVTLMTTAYAPTTSIAFQYTTTWIPWLFGAAVIAIRLTSERDGLAARNAALLALAFGVVCHSYVYGALLQRETFVGGFGGVGFEITKAEQKSYADLRTVIARIPPDASVTTIDMLVPHVSTRPNAYSLKVTSREAGYLLLSRKRLDGKHARNVRRLLEKRPYGLLANTGDFYLFKRGHESPATAAAFKKLKVRLKKDKGAKDKVKLAPAQ